MIYLLAKRKQKETYTSPLNGSLHRRLHVLLVGLLAGGFLFFYGLGVGSYNWPPFKLLNRLKDWVFSESHLRTAASAEHQIWVNAFKDPVINGDLIFPPIASFQEIRQANDSIFTPVDGFRDAYEKLNLVSVEQLLTNKGADRVVHIRFNYLSSDYDAYAYGTLPVLCGDIRHASLIIPGSGLNQSSAIYHREPNNYHYGILDALNPGGGELLTLIKPNEDIQAWHDGKGHKLNGDFIWGWHINRGGSYSASYILQGLAFVKWMKGCFGKIIIAGLSQGGAAAMLIGMQSKPDAVIVGSGHSVLLADFYWAGPNQIFGLPDYGKLAEPELFLTTLSSSPSQWLFTWGKNDTDIYRIEANEQLTAKLIGHLPNVTTTFHEGGHAFDKQGIINFLGEKLGSGDSGSKTSGP